MTTMTTRSLLPSRGDVVLVPFSNSDLRTAKKRPALIIQADHLETGLDQVIVALLSSRLFRANHPSRVLIHIDEPGRQGTGLLSDSVVMTDNLATIILQAIYRKIRTLPMEPIDNALRHTLGI